MSYELLEQSKREFKKDSRRVAIKNFPERTKKEEIDALLSSYHIETTHTDKNNESCKVVFANEVEAARCINEIGLKGSARGWHLEAKYTASDFMICVSHFPLEWNEKEFKDLIKDFGETEKCFLVRSSFLEYNSMGYGFLEFTSKSSAIKARNELHGYEFIYRDGKKYRIQVHWIDRIPDNYEDLQSCTVYCQLPDNIEWQNGGQIEDELHRFLSQKFDLVYFDCSKMKSDNFCIAEYDTSEQAAMTVRYLQSSPFPRYGPASPLQVTFSLPNIAGKVLLKSFQTFYEQFQQYRDEKGKQKGGLLSPPRENNSSKMSNGLQQKYQLDLERLTRQQALLLQQQQRNRDSGFQLSSAHAIKSLHSTPNNMTPMMKYDPKYDPQQLSNYSDPQLYTSHNTFPDIDIGGSGTFQSHGNNSMMEFYEHHSQFALRNSTNQNREPIRNNPNNHLDQSQVSVPTLLTSKRLDLLSEHPEKNLSQNLFNKNSYQRVQNNSAQNAYLSTEIDRQEWELQRLRRETQTQRDQMMRLELERKKREFPDQMIFNQFSETRTSGSLESFGSSNDRIRSMTRDQKWASFTPPRVSSKEEPSTKDSPQTMHLLGSLLDATPPQAKKLELAKTAWHSKCEKQASPGKDLSNIIARLGVNSPDRSQVSQVSQLYREEINSAARKRRNYEQQLELQELQEKRLLMSKQINNNNYIRHDNMEYSNYASCGNGHEYRSDSRDFSMY